jgi:hypothetical protein
MLSFAIIFPHLFGFQRYLLLAFYYQILSSQPVKGQVLTDSFRFEDNYTKIGGQNPPISEV